MRAEETDASYVWAETIDRFTRTIRNLFLTPHTHTFALARQLSFIFLLCLACHPASAQTLGGSCSTAGQATFVNENPSYALVCDGTDWRAALTYEYVSGIGGALMNMATDSGSCTTAKTGEINYNSGVPEFCNGTSWTAFGIPAVSRSGWTQGREVRFNIREHPHLDHGYVVVSRLEQFRPRLTIRALCAIVYDLY